MNAFRHGGAAGEGAGMVETLELLHGAIVDSWLERRGNTLVIQASPVPGSRKLWVIEADPALVDPRWLQDLSENLCHGSPISAYGSWISEDTFAAERLHLER